MISARDFGRFSLLVVLIAGIVLMSSSSISIAQDPIFALGNQDLGMNYEDGTQAIALDAGGVSPTSYLRVGSGFHQLKLDPFDRVTLEFPTSSTFDRALEVNTLSEGETFVVTRGGSLAWRVKHGPNGAEILCSNKDFYGNVLLSVLSSCPENVASLPLVVEAQANMIDELKLQVDSLRMLVNSMRSELDALKGRN